MSASILSHASCIVDYDHEKKEHVGGGSRRRIVAVAARVPNACIWAAAKHFFRAVPVLDHFHFITPYNEKLDVLRRCVSEIHRSASEEVLKATRWLPSKGPENLENHRNLLKRLQKTMAINELLAAARCRTDDRSFFVTSPARRQR